MKSRPSPADLIQCRACSAAGDPKIGECDRWLLLLGDPGNDRCCSICVPVVSRCLGWVASLGCRCRWGLLWSNEGPEVAIGCFLSRA